MKPIAKIRELSSKYYEVAKSTFLHYAKKSELRVSDEEFEFYKKAEYNIERYTHFKDQFHDNVLTFRKGKINWFALLFPVLWFARIKMLTPIFVLLVMVIIFVGGIAGLVEAISYNGIYTYKTSSIFEAMARATTICFGILMLPVRIVIGFYGRSIENLILFMRLKPIIKFTNETGKHDSVKEKSIMDKASWIRVVFVCLLFNSPIIIMSILAHSNIE